MDKECDELKEFLEMGDFPYHKIYFDKIVQHTTAILLLTGQIKAIHQITEDYQIESFQDYSMYCQKAIDDKEILLGNLIDCKIDV